MGAQKGIRRRWFRLVQGLLPLLGTCTLKVSQYPGRKGANVATAETYGRAEKLKAQKLSRKFGVPLSLAPASA